MVKTENRTAHVKWQVEGTTLVVAEKQIVPQPLKGHIANVRLAASLKRCPDTKLTFSGSPVIPRTRHARGFTMIELMVVISIIVIFMGIAVPMFNRSILRAREETLRSDLNVLNRAIVQYTRDKQKAPQSLDDLRTAGYIEKIPNDPITGEPNWEVEQDEVLLSVEQKDPGITGVHSASNSISSEGDAYSTW